MAINCTGGLSSNIEGYQIQGAQGIQGIQGTQGTQGLQGLKGPTGLPAPSAECEPIGAAPTRTTNGNVAFDPVNGGSYSWSDIEIDYSAHVDEIICQLHRLNDTHWSIKELMEVLVQQVTQIRSDQDVMAQQQTLMALHQANMDISLSSIKDNHDKIRIVQEHMRKLADTIGITTRSPYDYLYTYSTVRGLELDNISVGQAINAFNGLPAVTLSSPAPAQMPPPASKLVWKGQWEEDKTYVADDIVFYNGKAYTATKTSVGAPPADNKLWKSVEDVDVIKSEEPKEVWKGTWNRTTNYPAGSIVMFKEGLEEGHVNSLNDLSNSSAAAKIYKATENIPSYIESQLKPTDPPDAAGHTCWKLVKYNDEPTDPCSIGEAKGIQIVSINGDFTCNDASIGNLEVDALVVVEKICYTLTDFVQMYKGSFTATVYKAKAQELMKLYTGNDAYTLSSTHTEEDEEGNPIQVNDVRYGLARNPDHAGLAYWTTTALQQSWAVDNPTLIDAFFNSISFGSPTYTRHLTSNKAFDQTTNGCGFYDEPDNWSAGSTASFNWTSRSIPNTTGITNPAWGTKMSTYAIWDAPGSYSPIIRPISGVDGTYNIGVGRPIRISILGGPPNSTVQVSKVSNVNNFFYVGYIAGTVLSGALTLDAEGNFADDTQFFSMTGSVTYTAVFDNQYTILNGYTKTYTVNVFQSYPEPQIPTNPASVSYELAKELNIGYEFSREVVINFPFDGTYIFQAWVDNWARISLDGNKILDFNNNFLETSKPATKAITVKKGNHTVKLEALNYGPVTTSNPGGIGLSIVSGGVGLIQNHKGTKTYKIKTTDGVTAFKLVNLDDTEISTTPGLAEGYIFNLEKKNPNPNTTEIEFKGCWEDCTIYKVHQMVLHNEITWIATKDNTGNEPKAQSRYWREMTTEEAAFIDDPPTWKGAWNSDNTYVKHSIVSYQDKSWIALNLVQSVPTPPPPDEAVSDWKIVDDDTIRCQMPFKPFEPPPEPSPEEDTTLTFQGNFDPENPYESFDVVSTDNSELVFLDPPRIIDFIPLESFLINEEDPLAEPYDDQVPYQLGDIVLFDPADSTPVGEYLCVRPVLPTDLFNPTNKPECWSRLLPDLKPTGQLYNENEILPMTEPTLASTVPYDENGNLNPGWVLENIDPNTPGSGDPVYEGDGSDDKLYIALKPTTDRPFRYIDPDGDGEGDKILERSPNWAEILPPADDGGGGGGGGTNVKVRFRMLDTDSNIWKPVSDYASGPPINFVGPWDWRTQYERNDVVIFCNKLFKAVENSIGAVPPYNITNIVDTSYIETKWIPFEITYGTV